MRLNVFLVDKLILFTVNLFFFLSTKGKEHTHEKQKKNDAKFVMSMTSNFYANFLFDFDEVFIRILVWWSVHQNFDMYIMPVFLGLWKSHIQERKKKKKKKLIKKKTKMTRVLQDKIKQLLIINWIRIWL